MYGADSIEYAQELFKLAQLRFNAYVEMCDVQNTRARALLMPAQMRSDALVTCVVWTLSRARAIPLLPHLRLNAHL